MGDTNWQILVGTKVDTSTVQKQLDTMAKKTVTITPTLNTKGIQTGTKQVTQFKDAMGNLATQTQKFDNQGTMLSSTLSKVTTNTKKATSEIKSASKATKTLGQDFVSTLGKVAKFGAVTAILGAFTGAIGMATSTVKDFDDAITNFKKVSDLSGEGLDDYTKKLTALGLEVGRTATEMVQNATIFKQAGYSDEDSAQLAKVASLFQNVADSEVSASDAGSFLTAEMKAFNISAKDSIKIVDALNIIANNYAVSSTDISEGLSKSSASLATYGNTMSETMALITAG